MQFITSKLPTVARIFLGLVFFVFGLNGFFHFLPQPPMSGPPADFMGALFATKYMFPLIKGTEVAAGALLLSGRFVPLSLILLAPIVVNIAAFHAFLAPSGFGIVVPILVSGIYLAWAYRSSFAGVLNATATPVKAERASTAKQAGLPA
jgi:uncharacterized membrane protein YphA (DoxX/SURF4 family)